MDNIKISASFKLKGSIMYSEKNHNDKSLYYDVNTTCSHDKKKNKAKTVKLKNTYYKPCIQTISMSMEAYKYMKATPTANISGANWKRMSENQRITEHLKEIQHDLDAISFEFTVFND